MAVPGASRREEKELKEDHKTEIERLAEGSKGRPPKS